MLKSKLIIVSLIALMVMHFLPLMYIKGIFTLVLLIYVLIQRDFYSRAKKLVSSKIFWVLLIPFLLYAISILYSSDLHYAWKQIEIGLSLLIFPILLGMANLQRQDVLLFLKSLVITTAWLPLIGFFYQFSQYMETQDSGLFYNDNLVSLFEKQAVYYGFFINIALLVLFYLWRKGELKSRIAQVIGGISFLLLLCSQYLLASRVAIALTVLIVLTLTVSYMIKKLNKLQIVLSSLAIVSLGIVLIFSFPKVLKRFQSIKYVEYKFDNPNPINHFNGEIKKENWNGLNTRLAIWDCTIDAIQLKPFFGHGIGDGQKILEQIYAEKNFILASSNKYNTHNQYLHFALITGIFGATLFIGHLLFLLRFAIRNKFWLLSGFVGVYMVTGLTENVLGRNQGVVYISLLLSLLAYFSLTLSKKHS